MKKKSKSTYHKILGVFDMLETLLFALIFISL